MKVFCALTSEVYDVYGVVMERNGLFKKVPHFVVWDEEKQLFGAVPIACCTPVYETSDEPNDE